ncbi:MAG: tRNA (adenosine(37)-N6)-threonylcarbamoyltransferase complex ATPase subunit type 1 TsaE [Sphingobacteriia bacterium]|nr:tRNA (adenosine(37)-N6)-threonylcarbamoyltransferase complex ATPase subunit type 1 TsaE [Sphingobacteriia bacterium]NCC38203.1 tRNA (adenosine(37)-N6)-threonylcarbamoyltransferase complex ATPase subunit type 1 TsaE [Gammaproteobacteria bacterium]
MIIERWLSTPEAQGAFGEDLARCVPRQLVIYLEGDLGTGKTTLCRGLLRGLGHAGAARSPTYTLLEPYELATRRLYHLDLYRLGDPLELDYLGLRDLLGEPAIWVVEWPERGRGMLPPPDLWVRIGYAGSGRRLALSAATPAGRTVLEALMSAPSDEASRPVAADVGQ